MPPLPPPTPPGSDVPAPREEAHATPDAPPDSWDRIGCALLVARTCGCMLLLYIIMGAAILAVAALGLVLR